MAALLRRGRGAAISVATIVAFLPLAARSGRLHVERVRHPASGAGPSGGDAAAATRGARARRPGAGRAPRRAGPDDGSRRYRPRARTSRAERRRRRPQRADQCVGWGLGKRFFELGRRRAARASGGGVRFTAAVVTVLRSDMAAGAEAVVAATGTRRWWCWSSSIAVVVAVGLVSSEGVRFDGFAAMSSAQPVHLRAADGRQATIPMADLSPELAAVTVEAKVMDDEGYGIQRLDGAPLDRRGGVFKLDTGPSRSTRPERASVGPGDERAGGRLRHAAGWRARVAGPGRRQRRRRQRAHPATRLRRWSCRRSRWTRAGFTWASSATAAWR